MHASWCFVLMHTQERVVAVTCRVQAGRQEHSPCNIYRMAYVVCMQQYVPFLPPLMQLHPNYHRAPYLYALPQAPARTLRRGAMARPCALAVFTTLLAALLLAPSPCKCQGFIVPSGLDNVDVFTDRGECCIISATYHHSHACAHVDMPSRRQ